ncbi:MAG: NAD(P)/FAD-dependent oxidoreductase [Bacteroidota bacterium]
MNYDCIIVGGGAAGLMCAIEAGKRGHKVVVLERNSAVGEKIRISGGGRCNFTNLNADHGNYLSANEHFCKSALARFTTADFLALLRKHGIRYHEKKLGQLFCDESAQQIIDMLKQECDAASVKIEVDCRMRKIEKEVSFVVRTSRGELESNSLVIAAGGLSIPKLGATGFAYSVAKQFGIRVTETKPGLVPFKFGPNDVEFFRSLSGVSLDAEVRWNGVSFRENILFTHRGLSGPAILQISSYWRKGDTIEVNVLPDMSAAKLLSESKQRGEDIEESVGKYLPKRFVKEWLFRKNHVKSLSQCSSIELKKIAHDLNRWELKPVGTEGYSKAEVTVGGIDTNDLSSKTMEARKVPGLYFIGECVDVTGWLGGYNFQWAWASGWVAGNSV